MWLIIRPRGVCAMPSSKARPENTTKERWSQRTNGWGGKNNEINESWPKFLQPDTHTPLRHLSGIQAPASSIQPPWRIAPAATRALLLFRRSLFYNFLIVFAPNLCKIVQVLGLALTCELGAAYITPAMYNIWLNLISATQVNFDSRRVESWPVAEQQFIERLQYLFRLARQKLETSLFGLFISVFFSIFSFFLAASPLKCNARQGKLSLDMPKASWPKSEPASGESRWLCQSRHMSYGRQAAGSRQPGILPSWQQASCQPARQAASLAGSQLVCCRLQASVFLPPSILLSNCRWLSSA